MVTEGQVLGLTTTLSNLRGSMLQDHPDFALSVDKAIDEAESLRVQAVGTPYEKQLNSVCQLLHGMQCTLARRRRVP